MLQLDPGVCSSPRNEANYRNGVPNLMNNIYQGFFPFHTNIVHN